MKIVFLALGLVSGFAFFACTGSSSRNGERLIDRRASIVWENNESTFVRALQGHQKNDDFDRACTFFERLTGIHLHLNFYTFGVLPTPETDQDLRLIRAWYRENKYRLYWDEATKTVKLRGGAVHDSSDRSTRSGQAAPIENYL